jgi:hypothetical protein
MRLLTLIGAEDEQYVLNRRCENGGEEILPERPKKFSVAMIKLKSFGANERFGEERFCQCH